MLARELCVYSAGTIREVLRCLPYANLSIMVVPKAIINIARILCLLNSVQL